MPETLHPNGRAHLRAVTGSPARRVLVVANQTAASPVLIAELMDCSARGPLDLHLVVPALNSRLSHWLSDIDGAVAAARRRAGEAQAILVARGIPVAVEIGDSVPLRAVEDALAHFDADEILICTLPPSGSHWLEHDVVKLVRERFDVPVRHVVGSEERIGVPCGTDARLHLAAPHR